MPPPPPQLTNMKSQSNEYSLPSQGQQMMRTSMNINDFNNMYAKMPTPLVNAQTPGQPMMYQGQDEPLPANEGGWGSSLF